MEADKQMFILASEACRDGISKKPGITVYPVEEAFVACKSDPLIMSLLQPYHLERGAEKMRQMMPIERDRRKELARVLTSRKRIKPTRAKAKVSSQRVRGPMFHSSYKE